MRIKTVFFGALLLGGLFLGGCLQPAGKPPHAFFTFSPRGGEAPLRVTFDARDSIDPDGNIVSYTWDFGDGEGGEGAVVEHRFREEGLYEVTLTVTDDQGLVDIAKTELRVGISFPLDVLEWHFVNAYYGVEVNGRVRNIGQRTIDTGRITVRFYDSTGEFIAEASDYVHNLAPNQEADFTITTAYRPHQLDEDLCEIYTQVIYADIPRE